MEPKLYNFLRAHGFDDDDVQFLVDGCHELEQVFAETALKNISIVLRAGYPEDDIGMLIGANPNFLLGSPEHIEQILSNLENVEETLKNDPYLI